MNKYTEIVMQEAFISECVQVPGITVDEEAGIIIVPEFMAGDPGEALDAASWELDELQAQAEHYDQPFRIGPVDLDERGWVIWFRYEKTDYNGEYD